MARRLAFVCAFVLVGCQTEGARGEPESDGGGPSELTAPSGSTTISGTALLVGVGGLAGTAAELVDTSFAATTTGDGSFEIPFVPHGIYQLRLTHGAYEETIPAVIALPGGHGFLVEGAIHPLETVELQRAHRVLPSRSITLSAVSPDSQRVLGCEEEETLEFIKREVRLFPYASNRANLLLDLSTGTRRELGPRCMFAQLTPDGSGLLYATQTDTGTDLVMVPEEGGSAQLVHRTTGQEPTFTVSPDGWRIAVEEYDDTMSRVLSVISLADFTEHFVAANVYSPVFSPDGLELTFRGLADALYVASTSGGSALQLATQYSGEGEFTPDGRTFVFKTWSGEIRSVSVSGGATTLLASTPYPFRLASDGTRVVFLGPGSPYSLRSLPLAGGEATTLDTGLFAQAVQALAGGKWILYQTAANVWKIADPAGISGPVTLGHVASAVANRSGTHVAYFRRDSAKLELTRLSDGVVEWSVPSEPTYSGLSFSPDDATVAACTGTRLHVVATASGISTTLLSGCPDSVTALRWAPSGALLAVKRPPPAPHGYQGGLYVAHLP